MRWYLPDILRKEFQYGMKLGDTHFLIVKTNLSQAYQNAIKLRRDHAKEMKQLEGFLALINNDEARRKAARTIDGARSLVYFHKVQPWKTHGQYAGNLALKTGSSLRVEAPSVVAYRISEELGGSLVFSAVMRYRAGPAGKELVERCPFVYSGGKWRMVIFPMP